MSQEVETVRRGLSKRWLVLAAVLSSRTIYTINWFNIAPALLLIASELKVDFPSLGLLTSSFLLGAGLFQIPAGIMSARWGAKNTSQLGMVILSLSGIGEGISPNFPLLVISRLFLGIGAALFFAPAIGILTPLFREQEEGLVLGLYNSCFNIGGGIALFGWVIVIEAIGWRSGLVFGGLIGLASAATSQAIIPKDRPIRVQARGSITPTFRNRNIWIIAFGVLGLWGGIFSASSFLQTYMKATYGLGGGSAGLLASSIMVGSVFGGPIGGYLSDRYRRRKIFIFVPGLGASIGIFLFGVSGPFQLAFLIPIVGFLDAIVFSTMYASAGQYPEIGQQYAPLGISIINCVQILGSFGIPIVFTLLVQTYGNYSPGWFFMGGLAVAMIMLILLLEEPFKASGKRVSTQSR